MTSPTGILKQTTYHALELFARFMHGKALDVFVAGPAYSGDLGTDRPAVSALCTESHKWIDSSAALVLSSPPEQSLKLTTCVLYQQDGNILTVAIINRHAQEAFDVTLNLAGTRTAASEADIYELHHEDLTKTNTWESQPVKIKESREAWSGVAKLKAGSLQLIRITLV